MHNHDHGPHDAAPNEIHHDELDDFQRRALFVAQLQVMPEDWRRVRMSWRDVGRVVRDELFSAA